MRAFAALGVVITHVAFQTGNSGASVLGRIWGRFDLAVALFFGLSGFLLWRSHAQAARGMRPRPGAVRYLRSRVVRIMPAYLVLVVLVLLFLPDARGAGVSTWLANLTLTQVFVPLSLTGGLTQLWSLSVEVAFYLALPVLAWLLCGLRGDRARYRIPVIAAACVLSLGWGFVTLPVPGGVNTENWLPGYVAWFGAGMLLAELTVSPPGRMYALAQRRIVMALIALFGFALSCTDLAGPPGLTQPSPWQYATKIALGAVFAYALLAPLVLGLKARTDGDRAAHKILASPPALAVGRWSYAVFLWHLSVLALVFPAFGIRPFAGNMALVWVLTVALTLPVASASFALIEEPARVRLARWERRRSHV
ncbi:acyltransferase [Rhodococcus sp. D2-41]|nr:acyltransferase [Rhodococcus sp. D2-41]